MILSFVYFNTCTIVTTYFVNVHFEPALSSETNKNVFQIKHVLFVVLSKETVQCLTFIQPNICRRVTSRGESILCNQILFTYDGPILLFFFYVIIHTRYWVVQHRLVCNEFGINLQSRIVRMQFGAETKTRLGRDCLRQTTERR